MWCFYLPIQYSLVRIKNILKLVTALIICQLAGLIGSIFTSSSLFSWYVYLEKPSFTPPRWLFSTVWIILFVLMGISLYLLWKNSLQERAVRVVLFWFGSQLGLNILWSIIFFGLKALFLAFIEILLLWMAILVTIIKGIKVSKTAALLLIPYWGWVSFVAVLNFSIWALNV